MSFLEDVTPLTQKAPSVLNAFSVYEERVWVLPTRTTFGLLTTRHSTAISLLNCLIRVLRLWEKKDVAQAYPYQSL